MRSLTAVLWLAGLAAAQDAEERTRQLWNTQFLQKRPGAAKPATPPAKPPAAAPGSPALTAKAQPSGDSLGDSFVGITVWRLRPARPGDDKAVAITAGEETLTPERVEAETVLSEGQRVRVGIETARTGYLYVIDREQYSGGGYGPPMLIFPTLRTSGGRNDVMAGRLIEIPAWRDNPPYFTLRSARQDLAAEVLTVLVTPQPISGLAMGRDPVRLTAEQVAEWESKWKVEVKRLEARDQAGKPYTRAEKAAGEERTRLLTHEEPVPQTMYHCEAKPGEPLLVSVPLRIGR